MAVKALGKYADAESAEYFLNISLTGEHTFVHNEAKIALLKSVDIWSKIEQGNIVLAYGSIEARDRIKSLKQFLIDMLTDPNEKIRLMAVKALGKYADAESAEYLRRTAERDNSSKIRKAAQAALVKLGF